MLSTTKIHFIEIFNSVLLKFLLVCYISCISVTLIKEHGQDDVQKNLFWLNNSRKLEVIMYTYICEIADGFGLVVCLDLIGYLLFLYLFNNFFLRLQSLCSLGCLGTSSVDQASPPVFASQIVGLKCICHHCPASNG